MVELLKIIKFIFIGGVVVINGIYVILKVILVIEGYLVSYVIQVYFLGISVVIEIFSFDEF